MLLHWLHDPCTALTKDATDENIGRESIATNTKMPKSASWIEIFGSLQPNSLPLPNGGGGESLDKWPPGGTSVGKC